MKKKRKFFRILDFLFIGRYSNLFLLILILTFLLALFSGGFTFSFVGLKLKNSGVLLALGLLVIFALVRFYLNKYKKGFRLGSSIIGGIRKYYIEIILVLIALVGFSLRVTGIAWELEHYNTIDEPFIVANVIKMMYTSNFNHGCHIYGGFYFYILLAAFVVYYIFSVSSGAISSLYDLPVKSLYYCGRFVTTVFSTLTLLLVFRVGKKLANKKVGLFAAIFLCFSLLEIKIAKYVRSDVPLEFFCLLSFLFFLYLLENGSWKWYLLSGVSIGLTTGIKYNGLLIIFPFLLAHILNPHKKNWISAKLIIAILLIFVSFLIVSPYSLIDFKHFLTGVADQGSFGHDQEHWTVKPGISTAYIYSKVLFYQGLGPLIAILALGGIILVIMRYSPKNLLLISFPLFYFFFMSSYLPNFSRYILPVVAFFSLLAAMFLYESGQLLSQKSLFIKKYRMLIVSLIIIAALIVPAYRSFQLVYLRTQKSTLDYAQEWIENNLPEGSKILKDKFTPTIDKNRFQIEQVKRIKPKYYKNKIFLISYDYVVRSEYSNEEFPFYKNFEILREFKAIPGKQMGFDLIIYKVPPEYKDRLLIGIDLFKGGKAKRATINIGGEDDLFIDKGWNKKESDQRMNWRWSEGNFSTVLFSLNKPQNIRIDLSLRPYILEDKREQELIIYINDNFIVKQKIEISRNFRILSVPIKEELIQKGINRLRLQYSNVVDLAKITEGKDRRKIGLAFDYIRFIPID